MAVHITTHRELVLASRRETIRKLTLGLGGAFLGMQPNDAPKKLSVAPGLRSMLENPKGHQKWLFGFSGKNTSRFNKQTTLPTVY
jgi:hypothetical protein